MTERPGTWQLRAKVEQEKDATRTTDSRNEVAVGKNCAFSITKYSGYGTDYLFKILGPLGGTLSIMWISKEALEDLQEKIGKVLNGD